MSEIKRKFGYGTKGRYSSDLIEERAKKMGLEIPHNYKPIPPIQNNQKSIQEVFIQNSTYHGTSSLKKKILKYNLINYACNICGNTGQWYGRELSLQLHHISGINSDNQLSNLQFLCPNCHSQTDSYAGKGQRRAKQDDES